MECASPADVQDWEYGPAMRVMRHVSWAAMAGPLPMCCGCSTNLLPSDTGEQTQAWRATRGLGEDSKACMSELVCLACAAMPEDVWRAKAALRRAQRGTLR